MNREEMVDVATTLARMRSDLIGAIEVQQRRRRRRLRVTGVVLGVVLISGSAVASTTSFFTRAPDWVVGIFKDVPQVDEANAIKVGVVDDHVTYAAPADDGGFCVYYAPDIRSGPSGIQCVEGGHDTDVIPLTLEIGGDGAFLVGRVLAEGATSVDVAMPARDKPITTRVRDHGFFVLGVPDTTLQKMLHDDVEVSLASLTATARDVQGEQVAASEWDSTFSGMYTTTDDDGRVVEIHAPRDSPTNTPPPTGP